MPATGERLPALGLTIIRLFLGYLWLTNVLWKLPPEFGCGPNGFTPGAGRDPNRLNQATGLSGLCDWMTREANNTNNFPGFAWFPGFVSNLIIPNFGLFAWLTFFTEAFLAASLILGLFTRLGGLVGTLWAVNLFGGLIGLPAEEWPWIYGQLILLNGVFLAIGARLQYSVDGLLQNRYNQWASRGGPIGWLGRFFSPTPGQPTIASPS